MRLTATRPKAPLAALSLALCLQASALAAGTPTGVLATRIATDSRTDPDLASAVPQLRRLCTPLWRDLSPQCMATLDSIYLGRDVTLNLHSGPEERPSSLQPYWRPIFVGDRIAWRDVFRDPIALRAAVEAAAANSQCHARVGEARHDLREACAADAFARLSVLRHACNRTLYLDARESQRWNEEWARERQTVDRTLQDGDDYALRVAAIEESELHFAWRLRKCRAVPSAATSRITALRLSPFERYFISQWWELTVIAARIGSPWASARAGRVGLAGADVNATAELDLALGYLRRAKLQKSGQFWHLPHLLAARTHDLRREAPLLDWSNLQQHFSHAEIDAAQPAVDRILREGWQPTMNEEVLNEVTWPWAIAPPVLETRLIRRWYQDGSVRWRHEDGLEVWIGEDGYSHFVSPDGSESTAHSSRLSERRRPKLRRWVDEHGRSRWLDYHGREHWIDADGAEHWITFGGIEWILLPLEPMPGRHNH